MGQTPAVTKIGEADEKERSKTVQLPYAPPIEFSTPEYTAIPSLKKTHHSSSIQQTISQKPNPFDEKITTPATTALPSLPATEISTEETKSLGYELVKAIERNEDILREISDILLNNIRHKNKLIVDLTNEEQEKLNELIKQLSKKENADTVKSILNILTASSAIVVGGVLLAPEALVATAAGGTVWGVLLIASGVTNLIANEILPRVDGFEKIASFFTSEETKKQDLADNIQTATSITSTILSITSSIATGPFLGSVIKWSEGVKFLDIGLGLASGTANFIKDAGESQFKTIQSQKTLIDDKLKQERNDLDSEHSKMKSALDVQRVFNTVSANIISTLEQISQKDSKGTKPTNSYIGFEIANVTAESVKALNMNTIFRIFEIHAAKVAATEASQKTANAQFYQAIPHGVSAIGSLACSIIASIAKGNHYANAAKVFDTLATSGPKGAEFIATLQTKKITIESDKARSFDFDKQTKNSNKDIISSSIGRVVEIASKLLQTAAAA